MSAAEQPALLALALPRAFMAAAVAAALKGNMTVAQVLLAWAITGAECERLHKARPARRRR